MNLLDVNVRTDTLDESIDSLGVVVDGLQDPFEARCVLDHRRINSIKRERDRVAKKLQRLSVQVRVLEDLLRFLDKEIGYAKKKDEQAE